jgi:hypothetical protein
MHIQAEQDHQGRAVRDRVLRAVAPVAAFVLVGALVIVGSRAAFTATTANAGDTWTAGSVVLSDDDSNSAMFSATAMKPGDTSTHCIVVTYSGTLAAQAVELYATVGGTGLASDLNAVVAVGTGGSFADCTGFTATSTLYTGTLADFGTTYADWASGLSTGWSPTGASSETRTFQFTVSLPSGTGNAAQGLNASATFTWEAQNQ